MNGTSNTATSKEMPSIRVIAQGKLNRKSCTSPSVMMRNGKKVILIANVAEKIDLKKCVVLSMDACQRDCPSAIFSR